MPKKPKLAGKIEEIDATRAVKEYEVGVFDAETPLRKFVMLHSQGQEELEAITPYEAKLEGKARMLQKGMKYPQDRKDFYEVKP